MQHEPHRLQMAQWILERNLQWIAAAEAKTGVIVAINTAMLGALAAAFGARHADDSTALTLFVTAAAGAMLSIAIFCAAMSVLPRVSGPRASFIFFGCIVKDQAPDYRVKFNGASPENLLDDCLEQIHRNAEIACAKFKWVRASMGWSFTAVPFWVIALGSLIRR